MQVFSLPRYYINHSTGMPSLAQRSNNKPMAASSSSSSSSSNFRIMSYFLSLMILSCMKIGLASNFHRDFDITWGNDGQGKILNSGKLLTLTLDQYSGSAIQTKNQYLFSRVDMQVKLVSGDSAGTVTSFYFATEGDDRDEIDLEFLGNVSGDPYTFHTNIYTRGSGTREQQFRLWFDPTAKFHTYSIIWNPQMIAIYVDDTPVRVFKNLESMGIEYPNDHPMRIYTSIWNADQWATRGGSVKTNWTAAPFTASFRKFKARGCVWMNGYSTCDMRTQNQEWYHQKEIDSTSQEKLKWVQENQMIYNYCSDFNRFPQGLPLECTLGMAS